MPEKAEKGLVLIGSNWVSLFDTSAVKRCQALMVGQCLLKDDKIGDVTYTSINE